MGDSSSIWKRFTTNSSKSSNSGTSTTARNQHYAGASGASVKGHSDPDSNDDDNYNKKGTIMTAQSTTSTTTGSTPTAGTPTRNSSPASCSNGGKHHHPNKSNSSIHSNSSSSSNGNNRWNATHSPRKLMPASKISKGGGPPMFAPLWHFVKHHRNRDGMLLLVLWLASVMVGSILLSVVQQKTLPFRKRLNHRLLLLFRIEIVKRGQTPGRRHIAVRQNHYTTTSPTNAAADGSSTLPAIINNNDPATSTALKLRRSKADHRPSLLITNPLLMKECLTVTAKNRRLMSDWTVTNLGQAPDYPHYRELSDIFDGPGVWTTKRHLQRHSNTNNNSFSLNNESEQEQRVVEAVCVFRPLQYSKHFPHIMQQLYRCWSWWLAHPGKQPVFVYDTNELSNIFVLDFLDVMKNSMGLYISPSLQYHDSMYTDDDVVHSLVKDVVWTKNTGKWLNDIPVTDFAMLDPHKQLRRLFFEHAQVDANAASIFIGNNKVTSNNDDFLLSCLDEDMPRSQRRRPRIAILNRDPTDFRQLLNAHELASMIEAKFPDSAPVPVVEFMDNSHGREQFQFFLSTDILITPHGAQLSGMGLLPHCAQMMEFLPRDYLVADFFGSLAEATGVNHTFFYMDEGNHFDASISNSTTRIRHEERFHHFRNWDYRELHMCPNLAKVMDAVTELVSNWNPCCAAAVATANAAKDNQLLVPYPVQSAESSSNEIRRSTTSALTDDTHPVIDIISVGSIHRLQTLDAQKRTFGSHSWVRNMIFVTEHNDTEANCHVDFSVDKLDKLRQYCAKADNVSKVSRQLRTDLFGPSNHTGWMCAQKRPIDGLQIALEKYKAAKLLGDTSTAALPDYLMIIDDDTYLNINALVSPEFMAAYPPHEKHIVSGCTYMRPASLQFIFSVGGVGTFLSRGLVERLMKPIRCEKKFGLDGKSFEDAFTRWACWRLDQNHIGEKYFFQEGMSVGDLMYAYTSGLSLTEVESWKHDAGYCLHSDHTTGYFFSFYHLSVPEELLQSIDIPTDTMRKRFPFVKLFGLDGGPLDHSGRGGQCDNLRQICTPESRICHYTEPALMNRVFAQTQKRQRQLNNNPSSSNVDWIWITVSGPTLCSIFAIAWLVLRRKKTKRKI